jgi:iron complex transport system permease protein
MRRIPSAIAIPALLAAALGAVGLSLLVGSVPLREVTPTILWELRLGRAVLAFVAGAALGASGVTFQGLFRNPLADPFVVGVSGGAALGAVAAIVAGVEVTLLGLGASTLAAFGGGLGAAFLAYRLARVRGRVPVASLLLAGFAIGAFSGALVSMLLLWNRRNWGEVLAWLMGYINGVAPWDRVGVLAPFVGASLAAMAFHSRELDLMLQGEETAQHLGVEAERVKKVLLAAGTVAAAAAVAACGIIGFVGLVVPHTVRALVGPRHRALLPVTVLAGGTALVLADVLSRVVSPESPLPVGAVTALFGAPFFVVLLRRKAIR